MSQRMSARFQIVVWINRIYLFWEIWDFKISQIVARFRHRKNLWTAWRNQLFGIHQTKKQLQIRSACLMSGTVKRLGIFGFPKCRDMKNICWKWFHHFLVKFKGILWWIRGPQIQILWFVWKFQRSYKKYWNPSGIIN